MQEIADQIYKTIIPEPIDCLWTVEINHGIRTYISAYRSTYRFGKEMSATVIQDCDATGTLFWTWCNRYGDDDKEDGSPYEFAHNAVAAADRALNRHIEELEKKHDAS